MNNLCLKCPIPYIDDAFLTLSPNDVKAECHTDPGTLPFTELGAYRKHRSKPQMSGGVKVWRL